LHPKQVFCYTGQIQQQTAEKNYIGGIRTRHCVSNIFVNMEGPFNKKFGLDKVVKLDSQSKYRHW